MIKVAVTGNIASGKSVLQNILKEQGFKVLDTDNVSHELLTVKNLELYEVFKTLDVFENNEFSRAKLGELIFSNKDIKNKLELILHPQIRNKIEEFFEQNKAQEYVYVGIPLLFEAGMQDMFDKIILVYADDKLRLERLMKRNNLSPEQALARMNSQMSQDDKIKLCDRVIYNNGTIQDLKANAFIQE